MNKTVWLISLLCFLICCGPKQDEVERIMEDGVEVVINHLEPYKKKGEPTNLVLEEQFFIDFECKRNIEIGLEGITALSTDSNSNIYIWYQNSSDDFIFKFNREGNFITSFGRKGQGPGEIQFPTFLTINNRDEVVVTDGVSRKLIFFDQNGVFIKEIVLDSGLYMVIPLTNGNYLASTYKVSSIAEDGHDIILLCNSKFKKIKELDSLTIINRKKASRIESVSHRFILGVTKQNIYVGNSQRGYEIFMYALEGTMVRKIRKKYKPISISDEYKKKYLENASTSFKETFKEKGYFPKYFPPFQYGFADDKGNFFIMTYEKGKNPNEFSYDIFNPDGIYVDNIGLNNYGYYGVSKRPLFVCALLNRLYYVREKKNGFKELVVCKMSWNQIKTGIN